MKTLTILLNAVQNFVFKTATYLLARVVRANHEQNQRKVIIRFRNLAKPACQGHAGRAKKRVAITSCGLLLLGLSACIKSFDYQPDIYEQILVVEGTLTDAEETHQVRLSYTRPVDNTSFSTQIEDAMVYVQLGNGDRVNYTHQENGVYDSEEDFQAVEGETYQLVVELADGSVVTSDVVQMTPSPPIDSIYGREVEIPFEELNRNDVGVQFFVDTKDPTGKAKYFRYEWESTYLIQVPYTSYFDLDITKSFIIPREENVGTCYVSDTSDQLIIATSTTNATNRLAQAPIHFVSSNTDQLRSRYSIKVRQYVIDEPAFLYYKKLKEANESAGSLFDVQQGSVIGNLTYTENNKIPVLGYFEVAGVTELRRYFSAQDIPDFQFPRFRFQCSSFDLLISPIDSVPFYAMDGTLLIHNIAELPIEYILAPRGCASCAWYASTIKPEWWIR